MSSAAILSPLIMTRFTLYPTALVAAILSLDVVVAQCELLSYVPASRRASRVNASFPPDTATYDPAHLPPTTEQQQSGTLYDPLGDPERSFEAVRQAPTSAVLAVTKLHSAKTYMSTLCRISAFGGMKHLFVSFQVAADVPPIYRPPNPGGVIGEIEQISVAYCSITGRGTRLIPEGALKSAHL